MSEISEAEIKSMTKEQNYMRGYKDGKSDVLDKIKEEIRNLRYRGGLSTAEIFGYIKCLEIIDRYIEGEQK